MRVFIIAATLLAGALIPVQTAINSRLRVALFQSPVLASLVWFAVGTIALGEWSTRLSARRRARRGHAAAHQLRGCGSAACWAPSS